MTLTSDPLDHQQQADRLLEIQQKIVTSLKASQLFRGVSEEIIEGQIAPLAIRRFVHEGTLLINTDPAQPGLIGEDGVIIVDCDNFEITTPLSPSGIPVAKGASIGERDVLGHERATAVSSGTKGRLIVIKFKLSDLDLSLEVENTVKLNALATTYLQATNEQLADLEVTYWPIRSEAIPNLKDYFRQLLPDETFEEETIIAGQGPTEIQPRHGYFFVQTEGTSSVVEPGTGRLIANVEPPNILFERVGASGTASAKVVVPKGKQVTGYWIPLRAAATRAPEKQAAVIHTVNGALNLKMMATNAKLSREQAKLDQPQTSLRERFTQALSGIFGQAA